MSRIKVLLIDDEEDLLRALAKRLTVRGMDVATATSGELALTQIDGQTYDVVVLDLAMPGMDGMETLRRLKARRPTLPVVVLTGHAAAEKADEARNLGARDVVQKPAEFADLLARIRQVAESSARPADQKTGDTA